MDNHLLWLRQLKEHPGWKFLVNDLTLQAADLLIALREQIDTDPCDYKAIIAINAEIRLADLMRDAPQALIERLQAAEQPTEGGAPEDAAD